MYIYIYIYREREREREKKREKQYNFATGGLIVDRRTYVKSYIQKVPGFRWWWPPRRRAKQTPEDNSLRIPVGNNETRTG